MYAYEALKGNTNQSGVQRRCLVCTRGSNAVMATAATAAAADGDDEMCLYRDEAVRPRT